MYILGYILAGLAFFFLGIQLLTENLKKISGRKLRKKIAKLVDNPYYGMLWGMLFISISQSTTAATFIVISTVKSGIMKAKNALPIIIGINVFGAITIVLLSLDYKFAFYYILGISGIIYSGDSIKQFRSYFGILLGISFLFIGLFCIQDGVEPLSHYHFFNRIVELTKDAYCLSFLIGILLNILTQSTLAVAAILLSFQNTGMFSLSEIILILYGSCFASSMVVYVISLRMKGISKQVAMFQVMFNIIGIAIMLPLFIVEQYLRVPLVEVLVRYISSEPGIQMSSILIIFDCFAGLVIFFFKDYFYKKISSRYAEKTEEKASKPKYINEYAFDDAQTALLLVEKELANQLELIHYEFNTIKNGDKTNFYEMFEAVNNISIEINDFIIELTNRQKIDQELYKKINILTQIQNYLERLNESIASLADKYSVMHSSEKCQLFLESAIEGLDAVFLTLINVARENNFDDIIDLELITSTDGNSESNIRKAFLKAGKSVSQDEYIDLLSICNRCEKMVWLFKSLGRCYRNLER